MTIGIEAIEKQLKNAAARVVSAGEAAAARKAGKIEVKDQVAEEPKKLAS
jgi:hypothetical protein